MKKTTLRERVRPEKYGMIFCPVCNGFGRSFNENKGMDVCKVCGGFGLIRKEEKNYFHHDERPGYLGEFVI